MMRTLHCPLPMIELMCVHVSDSLTPWAAFGGTCLTLLCYAQARFAVLSAMDTYLHSSPAVQRAAVRTWQPIAALFSLLWDEMTRKVALSMVICKRPLPETVSQWSISVQPVIGLQGSMDWVPASYAFGDRIKQSQSW